MRKKVTLITGVSGEVGQALVKILAELGYNSLLTLDIRPLPPEYSKYSSHIQGDILDKSLLNRLVSEYEINTIFHMAALLSTRAEFTQRPIAYIFTESLFVHFRFPLSVFLMPSLFYVQNIYRQFDPKSPNKNRTKFKKF